MIYSENTLRRHSCDLAYQRSHVSQAGSGIFGSGNVHNFSLVGGSVAMSTMLASHITCAVKYSTKTAKLAALHCANFFRIFKRGRPRRAQTRRSPSAR